MKVLEMENKWLKLSDDHKNDYINSIVNPDSDRVCATDENYLNYDGFDLMIKTLEENNTHWILERLYVPGGCYDFYFPEYATLSKSFCKYSAICMPTPWDAAAVAILKLNNVELK